MKKFRPRKGQSYFLVNSRFEVKKSTYTGSNKAKARVEAGNCFKTVAGAKALRLHIISQAEPNPWWRFWAS